MTEICILYFDSERVEFDIIQISIVKSNMLNLIRACTHRERSVLCTKLYSGDLESRLLDRIMGAF